MCIVIKNRKKSIYCHEILKFFNITLKFEIKIVVYNIKLISNENYFYIFN